MSVRPLDSLSSRDVKSPSRLRSSVRDRDGDHGRHRIESPASASFGLGMLSPKGGGASSPLHAGPRDKDVRMEHQTILMQMSSAYRPETAARVYSATLARIRNEPNTFVDSFGRTLMANETTFFSIMQQLFLENNACIEGVECVHAFAQQGSPELKAMLLRCKVGALLSQRCAPLEKSVACVLECLPTSDAVEHYLASPDGIPRLKAALQHRELPAEQRCIIGFVAQLLSRCPNMAPPIIAGKKLDTAVITLCQRLVAEQMSDIATMQSVVYVLRVFVRVRPNDPGVSQPCLLIAAHLASVVPAEVNGLVSDVAAVTQSFAFAASKTSTVPTCLCSIIPIVDANSVVPVFTLCVNVCDNVDEEARPSTSLYFVALASRVIGSLPMTPTVASLYVHLCLRAVIYCPPQTACMSLSFEGLQRARETLLSLGIAASIPLLQLMFRIATCAPCLGLARIWCPLGMMVEQRQMTPEDFTTITSASYDAAATEAFDSLFASVLQYWLAGTAEVESAYASGRDVIEREEQDALTALIPELLRERQIIRDLPSERLFQHYDARALCHIDALAAHAIRNRAEYLKLLRNETATGKWQLTQKHEMALEEIGSRHKKKLRGVVLDREEQLVEQNSLTKEKQDAIAKHAEMARNMAARQAWKLNQGGNVLAAVAGYRTSTSSSPLQKQMLTLELMEEMKRGIGWFDADSIAAAPTASARTSSGATTTTATATTTTTTASQAMASASSVPAAGGAGVFLTVPAGAPGLFTPATVMTASVAAALLSIEAEEAIERRQLEHLRRVAPGSEIAATLARRCTEIHFDEEFARMELEADYALQSLVTEEEFDWQLFQAVRAHLVLAVAGDVAIGAEEEFGLVSLTESRGMMRSTSNPSQSSTSATHLLPLLGGVRVRRGSTVNQRFVSAWGVSGIQDDDEFVIQAESRVRAALLRAEQKELAALTKSRDVVVQEHEMRSILVKMESRNALRVFHAGEALQRAALTWVWHKGVKRWEVQEVERLERARLVEAEASMASFLVLAEAYEQRVRRGTQGQMLFDAVTFFSIQALHTTPPAQPLK